MYKLRKRRSVAAVSENRICFQLENFEIQRPRLKIYCQHLPRDMLLRKIISINVKYTGLRILAQMLHYILGYATSTPFRIAGNHAKDGHTTVTDTTQQ